MAWWVVQNLAVASLLAAGVWALCRLNRIGPTARHAMWLVVLVKLLTPPLVAWPWALPNPFRASVAAEDRAVQIVSAARPTSEVQPRAIIPRVSQESPFVAGIGHVSTATPTSPIASPPPVKALAVKPRSAGWRDTV